MSTAIPSQWNLRTEQQDALLSKAAAIIRDASRRQTVKPDADGLENVDIESVAGVFVTLKRKGRLRSCCGSFGQVMPLPEALHRAAWRTATDDPRFPRISPTELPFLHLDVWVLGAPEQVTAKGTERIPAVQVGTHGLQVIAGDHRGLLLPSVPVEFGWDAEEFLNQVCLKAGLPAGAWRDDDTTLLRFAGQSFERTLTELLPDIADSTLAPPLNVTDLTTYARFCRDTISALLSGATPMYYCPHVSDADVQGAAVIASSPETGETLTLFRVSVKPTIPLQSTLYGLCEELVGSLNHRGISIDSLRIDVAVFDDPALHGTLESPDLKGLQPDTRAVFVVQRTRNALLFDSSSSAQSLLDAVHDLDTHISRPTAQVVSFRCLSTTQHVAVSSSPLPSNGTETRPPAVAGRFYPQTDAEVGAAVHQLLDGETNPEHWSACMVPHAGWAYSGKIAADVLKRIAFPKTVIAIGPKHTPHGLEWAVAPHRTWSLPGGAVEADPELAARLASHIPGLELDADAHREEHGIEVQLPFIAHLAPGTRVVGVTIGPADLEQCNQFAEGLANAISELEEPPLLLISSDMNHFANDSETRRLDAQALAELDRLDPDALYQTVRDQHITMCGVLPAVIVLKTLLKLGRLQTSVRVGYATSADTTGDTTRCVGYAGMLFR